MDYRACGDERLVRLLGYDADAAEELFRRHVRPLTRHVRGVMAGADGADDVVSATFLAAIESAHRFDTARGSVGAWLAGIANNLIATQRRRSRAQTRALLRFGNRRDTGEDAFAASDARIDAGRTGTLTRLADLPPAESELMRLIADEGLTVPEAAGKLGIRPATARMRLARARARLLPHAARSTVKEDS